MAIRFGLRSKLLLALIGGTVLALLLGGLAGQQVLVSLRAGLGADFLRATAQLNAQLAENILENELRSAREMAQSKPIAAWLANENDHALRESALARAEEFRAVFRDRSWFMVPASSGNFYFNDDRRLFSAEPRYRMPMDSEEGQWFVRTLGKRSGYSINIQANAHLEVTKVWFNVVVKKADGTPLGIVGTGVELNHFLDAFAFRHEDGLTPIVVDSGGFIRMHMNRARIAFDPVGSADQSEGKPNLLDLIDNERDIARVRASLMQAQAKPGEVELLSTRLEGRPQQVALVWLPELQWYVLTAIDLDATNILNRQDVVRLALPALGMILLSALLFLFALRQLVTRRLEMLDRTVGESLKGGRVEADGLAQVSRFAHDHAGDEIGQLGETLRHLLSEISSYQHASDIAGLVIEHSSNAIIVADSQECILQVNPAAARIYGYAAADLIGENLAIFRHPHRAADFYTRAWDQLKLTGQWQGETLDQRQNKDPIAMWHQISALRDGNGQITHFIFIATDLSERKEAESRLHDLIYFDVLTGLPNRRMLLEQLERILDEARRDNAEVSLVVLNVDYFREINETIGTDRSDELLQAIAKRLNGEKHEEEIVAHLSVDEFAMLLPHCGVDQAARRTRQLLQRLGGAYSLKMRSAAVNISLTAGVSVFPYDTDAGDTLLSQAATASRSAKYSDERGEFRFFTREMNARAHQRFLLDAELRKALADGNQLYLAYQPQIDLTEQRVVGVEALLRWHHPERGMIPPGQFIPVAEESGLILEIGHWVLHEAVRQGAQWQRMGLNLRVAVNLSARQFKQSDLPLQIKAALDEAQLSPHLLELEITESLLMDNVERATTHLETLSKLGVQIALDDFGTGYSSLSYVQRFVLNRLKIDQSFVRDLAIEGKIAIVTTIIDLARNLGLKAIAEGVETQDQLASLIAMKCHEYQGYYFSRPVPASEIPGIVAGWPGAGEGAAS
ncbi:MAG: EAL domain-containing protein [Desulfobulbus sp.]|nr:EAL domain-containing protein [Desulfobulbus sp.]